MEIINTKGIKQLFKKCKIEECTNQFILIKKDFRIDIEKNIVDIRVTDIKGNEIKFYENNGTIKKIASKRILNRKMRMLSKFLNDNIFKIYNFKTM